MKYILKFTILILTLITLSSCGEMLSAMSSYNQANGFCSYGGCS